MNEAIDTNQAHEWTLQDYINIVQRRLWLIVVVFALVLSATLVYVLSRDKIYESGTTFVIENSDSELQSLLGNTRFGYWQDQERAQQIEFFQAVIASRTYNEMVQERVAADSVLRRLRVPDKEIDLALASISLVSSAKTDLMFLRAEALNPTVAYRIASIAIDLFKSRTRQVKLEQTRNIVDYVEKQKEIASDKLEETERALQEYNRNTPAMLPGDESGLLNKFTALEMQFEEVRTQRELAEANLAAYDRRLREMKAPVSPALDKTSSPMIQQLQSDLERLTVEKEQLQNSTADAIQLAAIDARINTLKNELIQRIINENANAMPTSSVEESVLKEIQENRIKEELNLYILKNKERYFQGLKNQYSSQHPQLMDRAIEEAKLKRGRSVYENLYNILLEKGEEARIRAATGTGGLRILDEPRLPEEPMPSNARRKIMLGIVLGLGLGLGLALTMEFLDHSIRMQDDVTQKLGLPLLGAVPLIGGSSPFQQASKWPIWGKKKKSAHRSVHPGNGEHKAFLITALRPRDPVVDTYRSMRTNLQFASVDKPIKSLVISSSIPSEGKTLTVANLAISYAELGKRVVIIDGDMRKPKQHEVFGLKKTPGLSDCLIKGCDIDQVLYKTHIPNLFLIPCGTNPPNPAEMIASQRLSDFLAHAESLFDLVIIDTPPANVVTDAILFSTKASHTMLVIKFASTNIRMVADAIANLRRARANLAGAVLNGVKVGRGYGYYNSYYSYYYSDAGEKRKR